jgi:hypothetical protein
MGDGTIYLIGSEIDEHITDFEGEWWDQRITEPTPARQKSFDEWWKGLGFKDGDNCQEWARNAWNSAVEGDRGSALSKAVSMLRRMEFSCDTHERTGKDTLGCPMCNGGTIVGLRGEHDLDCELAALLRELDS